MLAIGRNARQGKLGKVVNKYKVRHNRVAHFDYDHKLQPQFISRLLNHRANRELSGMGVGGEALLNKGMNACAFFFLQDSFTNLKMRTNTEDHSKYVIPATPRVDNVLCGHSRIVRELHLVLFLLFADTMQTHNCLSLIIPRVASSS